MTSLCPRCSTPRAGDYPICQTCGFDIRTQPAPSYGAPASPASPYGMPLAPGSTFGVQAAGQPPTNCPRCLAPLYPGYMRCGNCGFDSAQPQPVWATAPLATAPRPASKLPLLLAIGGVVLLVGAGVATVLAISTIKSPIGTYSASPSVVARATATVKVTPTPAATPGDSASAAPEVTTAPSAAAGTPEPSPLSAWATFTAPDGEWSADFPNTMTPMKQTMALDSGLAKGDMIMYMVADGETAYAMVYFDFPTGTLGASSSSYLQLMETSMVSSVGGTLITSSDATVGSYGARDLTIDKSGQTVNLRVWFVGDRFYMAMVVTPPGSVTYPQHFMSTVQIP